MKPEDFMTPKTKKGPISGPRVLILGSVHGNEPCGANVLPDIFALPLLRGTLTCVLGNPAAFRANKRFLDTDLNRMFDERNCPTSQEQNSREYQRAQELKNYIDHTDIVLDLHASTSKTSEPFLICESNGYALATKMGIAKIVSGFDVIQPGGTDWYANKTGKVGLCLESGFLGDPFSTVRAFEGARALLSLLGMIEYEPIAIPDPMIYSLVWQYTSQRSFIPQNPFADFAFVEDKDVIGRDGDVTITAPADGFLLFTRPCEAPNQEAFVFARSLANIASLRESPQ